MATNDVTVIACTRCHVRPAVASGLCAECVECMVERERQLTAFVEDFSKLLLWNISEPLKQVQRIQNKAAALLASLSKPTAEDV